MKLLTVYPQNMKYKTGDILINKSHPKSKVKVLSVHDLVVHISATNSFESAGYYYTEQEIDEYYTLEKREWKPELLKSYWYVKDEGELDWTSWHGFIEDLFRLKTKNCFSTKEEAEAHLNELMK